MSALLDKTIILDLTVRRPGLRRQMKPHEVEVRAADAEGDNGKPDQSFIHVGKDILRSGVMIELMAIARDLKNRIGSRSLPSPLKRGTYLVPLKNLEVIYADCEATKEKWGAKVGEFVAEYPQRVEEARERLGDLFNEANYPEAHRLHESFGLEWQLLEFAMPGESKVGQFLYAKESRAAAERVRNAEQEVISALHAGLLDLVEGLAETLKETPDGKRKILRDSRVEKAADFLEHFSSRNVLDDDSLQALAEEAKAVIGGRSADSLRKNDSLREHVQSGMADVATKLKAMAIDRPGRKFRAD